MSADLARLIVDSLDDQAPDQLARLLAPRLNTSPATTAPRWLRGARQIAEHIGCPRSRVYDLAERAQRTGIPIRRDGSRLVARTDELDMRLRG